ncbi:helix-turn-helix transcriptional regulator [Sphingomonas sp. RB1R13]|uniref:helix-turn-helix transcriptional regulator n=1 Tax=Sphingomonas sp. RB1R13 TaxID=3096159 RepID=UPI002FC95C23
MDHPDIRPVDRLTKGQADCLRLVAQHLSSKEIALQHGISPHTVDQRIRGALQVLGVERRSQAARMLIEGDQRSGALQPQPPSRPPAAYQPLIHQPPYIAEPDNIAHQSGAISYQIRHADRAEGAGDTGFETEQKTLSRSPLVLPFATRSHPSNEMSVAQKLTWIVGIAIGTTFSAGMYLAGLESLSRLMGH